MDQQPKGNVMKGFASMSGSLNIRSALVRGSVAAVAIAGLLAATTTHALVLCRNIGGALFALSACVPGMTPVTAGDIAGLQGPQGPIGPTGLQGPAGPAGPI